MATAITLVQGELEDYGIVNSDSSGRFWASGFLFQDTSQIAIAALDDKRKSLGNVELVPLRRPLLKGSFPRSNYQVLMMTEERAFSDFSQDYILLEEFVKEEMKTTETMVERNYGYGEPTQQVGPDKLERQTLGEILGLAMLPFAPRVVKTAISILERSFTYYLISSKLNIPLDFDSICPVSKCQVIFRKFFPKPS